MRKALTQCASPDAIGNINVKIIMSVIYILWLRQIKRYLRSKARMVGSLAQPLLFFAALGFGFGPVYQKAGGGNYIEFLAPGIIAMSIMFTAIFSGIEMIWDRQFGFLKETFVAPVSRLRIVIGRTLGGATVATLQGLVVLILTIIAGFEPHNYWFLPLALLIMFVVALMFTAFGTCIGSVLQDMQGFQLISNFLIMPIFFLSGALFPLEGLPKAMTFVASADPLSYGVDALRFFLTGSLHFGLLLDCSMIFAVTALLLALSSYLFSKIQM